MSQTRHSLAAQLRVTSRHAFIAFALLVSACKVTLIDQYNKESEEGLLRSYSKVERLFDDLSEATAPGARVYARFADRYADIQEMIRVQVLREGARPLNRESYGIISIIDTVFTGYRESHRRTNDVADVLIGRHRENMRRLFGAALKAERVKRDEGGDGG
jgi:hypothetical protein